MNPSDRLKGSLLGIMLADSMCTEKSSYLVDETTSSSLKMAESLTRIISEYGYYDNLLALDSYKIIFDDYKGPPGIEIVNSFLKNDLSNFKNTFERKFNLNYDEIFEDHPQKKLTERTGIFHRAAMLIGSQTLDDLITEVWMFDPDIDIFEEVYFFFTILRLLVKYGEEKLEDVLQVSEVSKIRQIVNEILTEENIKLRYIEGLDREEFCVFGAIYGAVHGYDNLMNDPILNFNSRMINSELLNEEFVTVALRGLQ